VISRVAGRLGLVLVAVCVHVPTAETVNPVATAAAEAPRSLAVGPAIVRELASGESHTYRLSLTAGDFLKVTIEQQGIDLAATLIRPDGRELLSVDAVDDDFRPETVVAVVDADGSYALVVRPVASTTPRGRYRIQVEALRRATAADAVRVEAERAFERGRSIAAARRPAAFPAALDELNAALSRYRQVGDRGSELKALVAIAGIQYDLFRPEHLATAQQAERIARELGDQPMTAAALSSIGLASERMGDLTAAHRSFRESTAISRAIGNRKAEARSLSNEGVAYGRTNDAEQAAARFEQALPLARASGDRRLESGILNNLGNAHDDLGELEKSFDAYRQALAHSRDLRDLGGQAMILNNMGLNRHRLGHDQQALELHQQALALSRETGGKENEARSLNTIGQTYYALGEYAKALDYHRESLDLRRQIGDLSGQAASLSGEGRASHRLGDDERSLAALHEALTIRRNIQEQFREADTLLNLAVVEGDRGNLDPALGYIRAAVDLEEALRARITSPTLRTTFVAAEQDKYELFIDLLQRQHLTNASGSHDTEAFQVSERARARVLLESLLDAHVDLQQGIEPALLERERALQKQLSDASAQLTRALAAKTRTEQSEAAAGKVDDLTRDYQQLQAEIRRHSPRYAALTQPQPLGAAEIQQTVLDDDTVLLEFALGEERSWLWAVTPRTIASVELPPRRAVEAAARSLYERFIARQRHRGEQAGEYARRVATADARLGKEAAAMSRMLFAGIAEPLNNEWRGKRLAIVATGALEYLPFAALPAPDSNQPSASAPTIAARSRRVAPLVVQHEIVALPSASVLAVLRRERVGRRPARRTMAIFADPVFERDDPRVGAKPPAANPQALFHPIAGPGGVVGLRAGLARLPFSREEANAIASLVSPADVFKVTDFKASRSTVLDGTLEGYRLVHFATHGVLDSERPSLSALVLSLVDERGAPRDGYLRLHDLYNLRLDADLVVLSACQTALGKEFKGEGLVGLTRAFMYAGVPRVVASLWEVSDLATAELMKQFYGGVLRQGLQPAAALRAAQRKMSTDPRWASPYYWAGFVLQGDWK
jgi:CHAT domain-containing protein